MNAKVPLVMIPGTLCTERTFAEQAASLRDVAAPSVLLPVEGSNLKTCAAEILKRAPERFTLLGFSLGGLVALEMMRQAPERVLRFCLLATNPRGSTPHNLETWARWRLEVAAGVRQPIEAHVAANAGLRVLDGAFMQIPQAVAISRRHDDATIAWVQEAVDELVASGWVAESLARHGQDRSLAAPPGH